MDLRVEFVMLARQPGAPAATAVLRADNRIIARAEFRRSGTTRGAAGFSTASCSKAAGLNELIIFRYLYLIDKYIVEQN